MPQQLPPQDYEDEMEYREVRQCDQSCPHFDVINSCCWLITEDTPGLFTEVSEYDTCIHGFKEDF